MTQAIHPKSNFLEEFEFPFGAQLSLKPLLRAWQASDNSHPFVKKFSEQVKSLETDEPQLFQTYASSEPLQPHRELVEMVLAPILSISQASSQP